MHSSVSSHSRHTVITQSSHSHKPCRDGVPSQTEAARDWPLSYPTAALESKTGCFHFVSVVSQPQPQAMQRRMPALRSSHSHEPCRDGVPSQTEAGFELTDLEWRPHPDCRPPLSTITADICASEAAKKTPFEQFSTCCYSMPAALAREHPSVERVALFHYATKSREDFNGKMARGSGMSKRSKTAEYFDGLAECAPAPVTFVVRSVLCACTPLNQACGNWCMLDPAHTLALCKAPRQLLHC